MIWRPTEPVERIFLTGFMGSGKTTVGPILAKKLGVPFIDLDIWIEKKWGLPVPDMIRQWGEPRFREEEKKALKEVSSQKRFVLATGGGVVEDRGNRRLMADRGIVVYLQMSASALIDRLAGSTGSRPLLESDDLEAGVRRLLTQREKWYQKADVIIKVEGLAVKKIVDRLLMQLGGERN